MIWHKLYAGLLWNFHHVSKASQTLMLASAKDLIASSSTTPEERRAFQALLISQEAS